jgi:negative regulator of flagellin synthesis FlgM
MDEDGGNKMNYLNGVGSSQQTHSHADVAAASQTNASAKTGASVTESNPATKPIADDQAKLSTTGGLISQALAGSDVRSDKVAALQNQISDGSYNVSSSALADKLIGALQK